LQRELLVLVQRQLLVLVQRELLALMQRELLALAQPWWFNFFGDAVTPWVTLDKSRT